MEIISRISKGSRMDQVYIPKNRVGFAAGSYVVVKPLEAGKEAEKPNFYNIGHIEPVKLDVINEILGIINKNTDNENIIITGSFLDKGFNFNDIDVILISKEKINGLEKLLEDKTGIKIHLIAMDNKAFIKGLTTDPLYQTMLSRCVSRKKFVYRIKPKIDYKILDLHLLKSKLLAENFDFLNGKEKYEIVRNAVAIDLFIGNKIASKNKVDSAIDKLFGKDASKNIKENMILDKKDFLKKYKAIYDKLFNRIMEGIQHAAKQE